MQELLAILSVNLRKIIKDNIMLSSHDSNAQLRALAAAMAEAYEYLTAQRGLIESIEQRLLACEMDKQEAGQLETNTVRRLGHLEQTGTVLRNRMSDLERTMRTLGIAMQHTPAPEWQVRMFDVKEDGDGNRR